MKTENVLMIGLAAAVFYAAVVWQRSKKSNYVRVTQYGTQWEPIDTPKGATVWI